MKGWKILLALGIVGMFVVPMVPATKATGVYTGDIAVVDISCVSRPIKYDNDEEFQAWLSNDGGSSINVEVKWYLDGSYVTHCYVTVPAGSNKWSPKVIIHWPDDFLYHKVTAKVIISDYNSDNNQKNEWFRASLITT